MLALVLAGVAFPELMGAAVAPVECRWAATPIKIDGVADDAAWKGAQVVTNFHLPWLEKGARPSLTATKARLLWDRDAIYFLAEMEDTDLYADVTEHNGPTWYNDVFELFFKPAANKPGYYEFEINAANTVFDLFLPSRGGGHVRRHLNETKFNLETAVKLRGTLNNWQDVDQGWTLEGRIPWSDFRPTGGRPEPGDIWHHTLCRYDYSVGFDEQELSATAPLQRKDFHRFQDYAPLKFIGPEARAKLFPDWQPWTNTKLAGSPEPPLPYRAVRAFPDLKLRNPIAAAAEPDRDALIYVECYGYSERQSKLYRVSNRGEAFEGALVLDTAESVYDLTFHPRFAKNRFVYLGTNGKATGGGTNFTSRVVRYTMESAAPFRLIPGSRQVVIEWPSNGHNGAALAFGLDGMLYVTSGDGTNDSDEDVVAQDLSKLLAKVLRIDVDRPAPGRTYSVPDDNPFVQVANARPETWAYGLRNPWRLTVDRVTGHLWLGENGQDLWEMARLVRRGENYGWSVYEGGHPFYLQRQLGPNPLTPPTIEQPHSEFRSLTGGIVYHGRKFPGLRGCYLYGDYSTGQIWAARHDGEKLLSNERIADTPYAIAGFVETRDGDILIVDYLGHAFYRLEPAPPVLESVPAFPRRLSETGLFADTAALKLSPGVLPYDVNAPLWQDGALGERFMALPAGTKLDLQARHGWNFPDHTVLGKTLFLELEPGNPASRRRLETQLLLKQDGEWAGYTYVWNDAQTDAELLAAAGAERTYTVRDAAAPGGGRRLAWRFASRVECMICHSRAVNFALGLSEWQLNRVHDFAGVRENQLVVLERLGLLKLNPAAYEREARKRELEAAGMDKETVQTELAALNSVRLQRTAPGASALLPREPGRMARTANPYDAAADLHARARSYLHANCSHCHTRAGGGNAAMELTFRTSDPGAAIFEVTPLHQTFGLTDARLVAPGDPYRSVLLHRVAKLGSGHMPPVGPREIDLAAVRMLRDWIAQLPAGRTNTGKPRVAPAPEIKQVGGRNWQPAAEKLLADSAGALELSLALDESGRPLSAARREAVVALAMANPNPNIRDLFERFVPAEQRVRRLGTDIQPAAILGLHGDTARGRRVFFQAGGGQCGNCHRLGNEGREFGPDLSQVGAKYPRAELLAHLLQPTKAVDPAYLGFSLDTKDGESYSGLLRTRSEREVVLRDATGADHRVAAANVARLVPQQLSLMPEGLLQSLTAQEAADLLAFLGSLR